MSLRSLAIKLNLNLSETVSQKGIGDALGKNIGWKTGFIFIWPFVKELRLSKLLSSLFKTCLLVETARPARYAIPGQSVDTI